MWQLYISDGYSLLCFTLSGMTGNTYYHCPCCCSEGSLRQVPLSSWFSGSSWGFCSWAACIPRPGAALLVQNSVVCLRLNQRDHITHFLGKPVTGLQLTFSVPLIMQEKTRFSVEQLVSAYARRLVSERCNQKTFLIGGNFPVLVFKMEVPLSWLDDM